MQIPTTLTPISLWEDPVRVVDLLVHMVCGAGVEVGATVKEGALDKDGQMERSTPPPISESFYNLYKISKKIQNIYSSMKSYYLSERRSLNFLSG